MPLWCIICNGEAFLVVINLHLLYNNYMSEYPEAKDLLFYGSGTPYRDVETVSGDILHISDVEQTVEELAESRREAMRKITADQALAIPKADPFNNESTDNLTRIERIRRTMPNPSDSSLDPEWNLDIPELSEEQRRINKLGVATARTAIVRNNSDNR